MFRYLFLILTLLVAPLALADNGLITKRSDYSVTETINRLETALKKKGIRIALRWSHSERAEAVGIPLRPTELLIFGNPKLGSRLFTSDQRAGIDLPMKALAWEDAEGKVWLSYNDPHYIARRHHIDDRPKAVEKMSRALNKMSDIAVGRP